MAGHVIVDPAALLAAAADLDAAASRLGGAMAGVDAALRPVPAGAEEVSVLAAHHFWSAAESVTAVTAACAAELHRTATALRVQAEAYRATDAGFGAALTGGGPR